MGFNEFKELWGALNQWKVSGKQGVLKMMSPIRDIFAQLMVMREK